MREWVYVVSKNGNVYAALPTLEKAKAKVAQVVAGGWYEIGGDEVLRVDAATWTITPQRMEE